jgi:zinc protease
VASKFNGIKNRLAPAVKDIKPAAIPDRIEIKNVMDKEQAVVMVGFRSAGLSNPDRYPLQILSSIFSGGSGRLYTNIRQDKAMAYTLGTFGMIGIDAGSFIFYAATRPEDLDSVKDEIIKQIKRVCDGDITDEEISSAKKSLVAKHRLNQQSVGTFAAETALDELYGLGYDNYARYPENISKVSREELIQAANKYFTLKNCVISTTVPKK